MANHKLSVPTSRRVAPLVEALEGRQLLSAAPHAGPPGSHAGLHRVPLHHGRGPSTNAVVYTTDRKSPRNAAVGQDPDGPILGAYTPSEVRRAYGLDEMNLDNQGQGMTIGIVDDFDDPDITADTDAFSAEYELPQMDGQGGDPSLTVYKDTAYGPVTSSANGYGDAYETSIDVQWAHAIAPYANILLVETPALSTDSLLRGYAELLHGAQYAAAQGAASVSISYGNPESQVGKAAAVIAQNQQFLASGPLAGTVVTVSAGDNSTPLYPAVSPDVVAVGGTSLYFSSLRGTYGFEKAWGGNPGNYAGGGGLSSLFPPPAYQSKHGVKYATRAVPDVSMDGDVITGFSIYESLDATAASPNPWNYYGGTSVAAPMFAAVAALAQQDRVAAGKPMLTSAQLDGAMYAAYQSASYPTYFHDVTQGNNGEYNADGTKAVTGYPAKTGYDLATGIGTPKVDALVPYLAGVGT